MRFYTQQIAWSSIIVGIWVLLVIGLTTGGKPAQSEVAIAAETPRAREKFEPRDERTGEVCRIHRFDELETRTQTEIRFQDKTRAIVYFNMIGLRTRAEEIMPDGSKQVFIFDRMGTGVVKIQGLRPDGTLKSETVPVPKEQAVKTIRFAADGKTRYSETLQFSNKLETTVFEEDGRNPKLTYKQSGLNSELVTYENGALKTRDTIERRYVSGGYMMMGMPAIRQLNVSSTTYRKDGTVWFKQKWVVTNGSASLKELDVLHEGGKTVSQRYRVAARARMMQTGIFIVNPGMSGDTHTLETFDKTGNLVSTKALNADFTVARLQLGAPKPEVAVKAVEELLTKPAPGCKVDEIMSILSPKSEPNHLQQIMSE